MTIPVQRPRKIISGSGWANPLVHDYPIENVTDVGVFADSEELTLGVHYSVSGVGDPAGYTVTITNPEDWSPGVWVLDVQYPINQPSDVDQGGQFGARFEAALDRMARSDQVVYERARRSLAVDRTTPLDAEVSLPAAEANSLLGWTSDGAGLENKGSIPQIQIVAANIASIVTTAESIAAVLTVAAKIDDVVTVGGIAADVTTVANSASQVGVVAGIASQVVAVAGVADDLADVIDNMESIQNASANAQAAEDARDKAEEWAESLDEVEPGKWSSKHWAEVAASGMPLGAIIYSAFPLEDQGFLLADGAPCTPVWPDLRAALIAAGSPFGNNGTDPLLPDEVTASRFRRAANEDLPVGTVQDDQMQRITGTIPANIGGSINVETGVFTSTNNGNLTFAGGAGTLSNHLVTFDSANSPGARTGDETHPKSIAYLPYIKAFGAITIEGMADLSALFAALATEIEAVAGTDNTKLMTALRVRQAMKLRNSGVITLSGTSFEVTGIPADVQRVFVDIEIAVSSGTTYRLELGSAAGFPTTGYFGAISAVGAASVSSIATNTAYIGSLVTATSTPQLQGSLILTKQAGDIWKVGGSVQYLTNGIQVLNIKVSDLVGPLSRLRLSTGDARTLSGKVKVWWEF